MSAWQVIGYAVGGIFLGFLVWVVSMVVWASVAAAVINPRENAAAAMVMFCGYLPALVYLVAIIWEKWPLSIAAAMTFLWCVWRSFKRA